jgi:hypothetical protein
VKYILLILFLAQISQCSNLKKMDLYKGIGQTDPIKYIKFSGSERYEYFIEAEMINNDSSYYYNIGFLKSGKIMHVEKFENRYLKTDNITLEYEKSRQFLFTDTTQKWGPTYFGEGIDGYYDTLAVNNYLNRPNPLKTINEISDAERRLFNLIDSLASVEQFNLNKPDSTGIIGWLKYNLK